MKHKRARLQHGPTYNIVLLTTTGDIMRATLRTFFLLLIGLAFTPAAAQEVFLGLDEIPPEQYAAIPELEPPFSGASLPDKVDLSSQFPTPGYQNPQQSCVGWAVAYALKSYQEAKENGWPLTDGSGSIIPSRVFSPSFVYNQVNGGMDTGSNFIAAFNILLNQGAAPLSAMPYVGHDYLSQPSNAARASAEPFKIASWSTVVPSDTLNVKAQLNRGFPIVIGAVVDHNYVNQGPGVWTHYTSPPAGRHAMVVVGYDDAKQAFKVINSWGTGWGDEGYGWIGYDHFARVVEYAFVVVDAKTNGAPDTPVEPTQPTQPNTQPWLPPASPFAASQVAITNIQHNIGQPGLGVGMIVQGQVWLPPQAVGTVQLVVQISFGNGAPVRSRAPQFAMPDGQAATGTQNVLANGMPQVLPWTVFLPYCVMDLPSNGACVPYPLAPYPAVSNLSARTILYANGLSVAEAMPFAFTVAL
jgi:hypothetical protein